MSEDHYSTRQMLSSSQSNNASGTEGGLNSSGSSNPMLKPRSVHPSPTAANIRSLPSHSTVGGGGGGFPNNPHNNNISIISSNRSSLPRRDSDFLGHNSNQHQHHLPLGRPPYEAHPHASAPVSLLSSGAIVTDATLSPPPSLGSSALTSSRQPSSWLALPPDSNSLIEQSTETFVHRLHRLFQLTALPTAMVLGIFFMYRLIDAKLEVNFVAKTIALYCTVVSVVMTGLLIYMHCTAYTDPVQQRRIVRILIMIPIYAVSSCLALWHHRVAPYIGLMRDCYESYVIYNFFFLLMGYLGGEEYALATRGGSKVSHMVPLCCLPPFPLTARTFGLWKLLLIQYMLLKPFFAFIAIGLGMLGVYDEASWSFRNAHVYFVIIMNVSVTAAFTTLLYFFKEFRHLLAPHSPFGKFAAVKAVVFLSFWQGVMMGVLVHMGIIHGSQEGQWTGEEVSTGVQDFLICNEMLLMCYLHHRVFPEKPYVPLELGHQPVQPWVWRHLLSISDVVDDSVKAVRRVNELAEVVVSSMHENGKQI